MAEHFTTGASVHLASTMYRGSVLSSREHTGAVASSVTTRLNVVSWATVPRETTP